MHYQGENIDIINCRCDFECIYYYMRRSVIGLQYMQIFIDPRA